MRRSRRQAQRQRMILGVAVLIVVVAVGGWRYWSGRRSSAPTEANASPMHTETSAKPAAEQPRQPPIVEATDDVDPPAPTFTFPKESHPAAEDEVLKPIGAVRLAGWSAQRTRQLRGGVRRRRAGTRTRNRWRRRSPRMVIATNGRSQEVRRATFSKAGSTAKDDPGGSGAHCRGGSGWMAVLERPPIERADRGECVRPTNGDTGEAGRRTAPATTDRRSHGRRRPASPDVHVPERIPSRCGGRGAQAHRRVRRGGGEARVHAESIRPAGRDAHEGRLGRYARKRQSDHRGGAPAIRRRQAYRSATRAERTAEPQPLTDRTSRGARAAREDRRRDYLLQAATARRPAGERIHGSIRRRTGAHRQPLRRSPPRP